LPIFDFRLTIEKAENRNSAVEIGNREAAKFLFSSFHFLLPANRQSSIENRQSR